MTQNFTSIFKPQDLQHFANLESENAKNESTIRGPYHKWNIKGPLHCGKFTTINGAMKTRGQVTIGSYCAFGQNVSLISGNHRTDMPNQQIWLSQRFGFKVPATSKGPIEIGHNVWIGDSVIILSGVQIGHGSVIAAGSTVTKSVPPFTIVGGAPAKQLRARFTDAVIKQFMEIEWWNWPDEKIAANQVFFEKVIPHDVDVDLKSIIV